MYDNFEQLQIAPVWAEKLKERGIGRPTAVQAEAIPLILTGRDAIVQSQTGTGKTLAFLLPALQRIDVNAKRVQAAIIVPTRELGMQILRVAEDLIGDGPIKCQALIGGAALARQVEKLKKGSPHLIIGTPGRINELIKARKLNVHHVSMLVVDEVDHVLELGSMKEVYSIFKALQRSSQSLFFSATIPAEIGQAAESLMNDPAEIRINPDQRTASTLEHLAFNCEARNKIDTLRRIIRLYEPPKAMVFVNATADVSEVVSKLQHLGLSVEALYGEAGKQQRANVMQSFREGKFQLLLATDVAARGLDIEEVTHVINLDMPLNAEYYLHRAGRTGRMGRSGTVISIVAPKERFIIDKFRKSLRISIHEKEMYEGRVVDAGQGPRSGFRGAPRRDDAGAAARVSGTARSASGGEASGAGGERLSTDRRGDSGRSGAPARTGRGSASAASRSGAGEGRGGAARGDSARQPVSRKAARKQETAQDRKNKGAPKWLKAKRDGDGK
ncbi:DEAD/DEAH box helicase [Paenibacillus chitinolyticus]|uniref:DEAD/DEAH box helicase n=1 Tax=Paenibacillus chitinolyticus TaxID=79263 RepID=UPI0026E4CB6D|nr:DEAD/DEAH box helicase [Paenibacillus chitinolyticus]GKS14587.1 DEAD/DEAH box helicase [Paenibacillus chitinolyticus]